MQEPKNFFPETLDPEAISIIFKKLTGDQSIETSELVGAGFHALGFGLYATLAQKDMMYGATEAADMDDLELIRSITMAANSGEVKAVGLNLPWKLLVKIGIKMLEAYLQKLDD